MSAMIFQCPQGGRCENEGAKVTFCSNLPFLVEERQVSSDPIKISSFEELIQHEQEILARIAKVPNGRNLFMAHPFLMLADVGVELSAATQAEIIRQDSYLTGLSPISYRALKATKHRQRIRFHLRGLFQRRET
jgi:hypothetical protein